MTRGAHQALGAALPLDEAVGARARRVAGVHRGHEADVRVVITQGVQERGDGGVETASTLAVHVAAVGEDHRVDAGHDGAQVVGGGGRGFDDLDAARQ